MREVQKQSVQAADPTDRPHIPGVVARFNMWLWQRLCRHGETMLKYEPGTLRVQCNLCGWESVGMPIGEKKYHPM